MILVEEKVLKGKKNYLNMVIERKSSFNNKKKIFEKKPKVYSNETTNKAFPAGNYKNKSFIKPRFLNQKRENDGNVRFNRFRGGTRMYDFFNSSYFYYSKNNPYYDSTINTDRVKTLFLKREVGFYYKDRPYLYKILKKLRGKDGGLRVRYFKAKAFINPKKDALIRKFISYKQKLFSGLLTNRYILNSWFFRFKRFVLKRTAKLLILAKIRLKYVLMYFKSRFNLKLNYASVFKGVVLKSSKIRFLVWKRSPVSVKRRFKRILKLRWEGIRLALYLFRFERRQRNQRWRDIYRINVRKYFKNYSKSIQFGTIGKVADNYFHNTRLQEILLGGESINRINVTNSSIIYKDSNVFSYLKFLNKFYKSRSLRWIFKNFIRLRRLQYTLVRQGKKFFYKKKKRKKIFLVRKEITKWDYLKSFSILLNFIISGGRLKKAFFLFYRIIVLLKFKYKGLFMKEYFFLVKRGRPLINYRDMHIGGKKYKIPILMLENKSYCLSTRWLLKCCSRDNLSESIFTQIETSKKKGIGSQFLKFKKERHSLAFENKSYIRFLRFLKKSSYI